MKIDALEEAWQFYQAAKDCFRVTQRVLGTPNMATISGTEFVGKSIAAAKAYLTASQSQNDKLAIVALWAAFERELITYLQSRTASLRTETPVALSEKLQETVALELERWRVDQMLDTLKPIVDADLIGHAKQVKRYRDWVAHRNPKRPPAQTDPGMAFTILSSICTEVSIAGAAPTSA